MSSKLSKFHKNSVFVYYAVLYVLQNLRKIFVIDAYFRKVVANTYDFRVIFRVILCENAKTKLM